MATIRPEDAYGLALIAKDPENNGDLVESLSPEARPIGENLIHQGGQVEQDIFEAAEALRRWADRNDE